MRWRRRRWVGGGGPADGWGTVGWCCGVRVGGARVGGGGVRVGRMVVVVVVVVVVVMGW